MSFLKKLVNNIIDEVGYTLGATNPDVSEWMYDRVMKRAEKEEEEEERSYSSKNKSHSNRW